MSFVKCIFALFILFTGVVIIPLTYLGGLLIFFRRMANTIESDWWSANFVHLIEPVFFIPVFIFVLLQGVYILDVVFLEKRSKGIDRFLLASYGLFVYTSS